MSEKEKSKILDQILEIAFLNPTNTILVKVYDEPNEEVDVYASDYLIAHVDEILTQSVWRVKIEQIEGVVEGKWRVVESKVAFLQDKRPSKKSD